MKIMKYQAATEKEAMLMAKDELGKEALILSIKSVKPKGIFRLFRKAYVEVTAALDENTQKDSGNSSIKDSNIKEAESNQSSQEVAEFRRFLSEFSQKQKEHEKLQAGTEKAVSPESSGKAAVEPEGKPSQLEQVFDSEGKASPVLQVIYEQLQDNEVETDLIDKLLSNLAGEGPEVELEQGIDKVYRQIVEQLSDVRPIKTAEAKAKAKPIFFIGSTGVGKTTTIAKLASLFTLRDKCKVALITADTYRIAAVEQLRTYANILNIPIKVIYKEEEIVGCLEEFADMDLILIDTAGRSYQDTKHLGELKDLLAQVPDKQVYLVLSLSTKNSDLMKTVAAYEFADFSLIFTKLDETLAYGSIFNISQRTGRPLSYVTTGQNVPDDIAELDPYEIASKILGGVNS